MRKIKFLFIFTILFFSCSDQQDSYEEELFIEAVEEPTEYEVYEEEAEVYIDEENTNPMINPTPGSLEREPTKIDPKELNPKFKDNYTGKEFDYEEVEKEEVQRDYVNKEPLFNLTAAVVKVIMYILLIVIVLAIAYYIIKNSGGFSFGKERQKINYTGTVTEATEDEEDINNNDFERLIQRAKTENNYRLAIRYYFLWVLQVLSDKKLINWNKDKTNYEYFIELDNQPIKDEFFNNTHIYDYIWYGNFEMNGDEFRKAESIFQKTLNKLK